MVKLDRRVLAAFLALAAAHWIPRASAEEGFFGQNYASTDLLNDDAKEATPSFDASLSAEQAAAEKLLYSPSIKQSSTRSADPLPGFPGYEGRFTRRQAGVERRTVPNDQSTIVVDR